MKTRSTTTTILTALLAAGCHSPSEPTVVQSASTTNTYETANAVTMVVAQTLGYLGQTQVIDGVKDPSILAGNLAGPASRCPALVAPRDVTVTLQWTPSEPGNALTMELINQFRMITNNLPPVHVAQQTATATTASLVAQVVPGDSFTVNVKYAAGTGRPQPYKITMTLPKSNQQLPYPGC